MSCAFTCSPSLSPSPSFSVPPAAGAGGTSGSSRRCHPCDSGVSASSRLSISRRESTGRRTLQVVAGGDPADLRFHRSVLIGASFASFGVRGTQRRCKEMGNSSSASRAASGSQSSAQEVSSPEKEKYASISDAEWKKRLTKEQFDIARKKGTERAFTGEYWKTKTSGTYECICCSTPLFDSKTKFDSGTGWPSYWDPIGKNVKSESDWSIPFMPRTEVLCATCDAHLGHVFNDGPAPSGKRYCINSVSIKLKPSEK